MYLTPPDFADLPAPPADKTAWPWTASGDMTPPAMSDGSSWPKISIVTPSYNSGPYIEETIRAVLLQGYPNLEYIIVDGGSTDETTEIIRKYEPWLTYWVSEPDEGWARAVVKGLQQCSGEIFNWSNADDYLAPGALAIIAERFRDADLLAGSIVYFGNGAPYKSQCASLTHTSLIRWDPGVVLAQPACWMKREYVAPLCRTNTLTPYAWDWYLLIRYLHLHPSVSYIDDPLAYFRIHPGSKSVAHQARFKEDEVDIMRRILSTPDLRALHRPCRERLWSDLLAGARAHTRFGPLTGALSVAFASCADPQVRWTRQTLAAVKALLRDAFRSERA